MALGTQKVSMCVVAVSLVLMVADTDQLYESLVPPSAVVYLHDELCSTDATTDRIGLHRHLARPRRCVSCHIVIMKPIAIISSVCSPNERFFAMPHVMGSTGLALLCLVALCVNGGLAVTTADCVRIGLRYPCGLRFDSDCPCGQVSVFTLFICLLTLLGTDTRAQQVLAVTTSIVAAPSVVGACTRDVLPQLLEGDPRYTDCDASPSCTWSGWSPYSDCNAPCGGSGTKTKTRRCEEGNGEVKKSSISCSGRSIVNVICCKTHVYSCSAQLGRMG